MTDVAFEQQTAEKVKPPTAVLESLRGNDRSEADRCFDAKPQITLAPGGYARWVKA
jgi:hypothetical protein